MDKFFFDHFLTARVRNGMKNNISCCPHKTGSLTERSIFHQYISVFYKYRGSAFSIPGPDSLPLKFYSYSDHNCNQNGEELNIVIYL